MIRPKPMGNKTPRWNADIYATALDMLWRKPTTAIEIEIATGLSTPTVWKFLRSLRAKELIYISHKLPDSTGTRLAVPVWKWGPRKPDTFLTRTPAQNQRAYATRRAQKDALRVLARIAQPTTLSVQAACPASHEA